MRCSLCGFLIIKLHTALHHAVWCGAVYCYLWCGEIMLFCGQFWCSFYGLVNTPIVNSARVHCSRKKSTFTAKKKKKKAENAVQNANHPDPNATLGLNFLSARSLQLKWMKEGRKGSVIIVMRSGSLNINNRRATNSLKTFARFSPRRNY